MLEFEYPKAVYLTFRRRSTSRVQTLPLNTPSHGPDGVALSLNDPNYE